MLVKTIDIGSIAGIDEALTFLEDKMSEKALQDLADKIASELIGGATDVARQMYAGTGVIVTRSAPTETGKHSILATDDEIAFIEFGIGWGVNAKNEFAKTSNGAPPVHVGSWSEQNRRPDGRRGPFYESNYTGWHYGGEYYNGTEADVLPRPGMEMARQYVTDINNINQAVREALHLD